ncbi:hypothetical protein EVAR_56514_1 [Eumeta japonica]|uniref:Uncharacterized protein n=1 Tax=Eumeta variegata TaxID=151549 RepID=A0A4C1Z7Q3_EUMVA|nr:hypothetical protein EVAR_56514_1 [Eumeta japonica]
MPSYTFYAHAGEATGGKLGYPTGSTRRLREEMYRPCACFIACTTECAMISRHRILSSVRSLDHFHHHRLDLRFKHNFLQRTTNFWNDLPSAVFPMYTTRRSSRKEPVLS